MVFFSLNTKLVILLISISTMSISALAIISIDIMQQSLKKDASLRLNVIAADRIQTLKSIWDLRLQQVEALAADGDIQSLLRSADVSNTADNARLQHVIEDFDRLTTERDGEIYDVIITDADGKVIFSMNKETQGQYVSSSPIFSKGVSGAFYQIDFDAQNNRAMLVAASPITDASTAKPLGAVAVMRDINAANNILTDKRFLGETGEIYLVDEVGLMITDSRFVKDARYSTQLNTVPVTDCFERGGADINGALYMNYRNILVFGASQCEKNIGVLLISELESSELFGPMLVLQRQYGLIATAIVVGSSVVAFFVAMSILKPLQKLRKIMKRVQEGEFTKTDIIRGDEIGDLAKSFNSMVEEIAVRTKRLHLKNDILSFMSSRLEVQAQELLKADREKEEFAALIAHESKLVLVPIIGYSELLLDGTLGQLEQKQKEKIRVILERAWSLMVLIQNILDARRLESGDLKMNMQNDVSPEALVIECAEKMRALIESQGHKLIVRIGTTKATFCCDPERILQILNNLLSNSLKFSCPGKQNIIELAVKDDGSDVIFSVMDKGIGIPQKMQNDLFKKFYNLDKSLTRKQGVSLDLIISQSIVKAHGGKIWVESDGIEGRGSIFFFTIPIVRNESPATDRLLGGVNRS